MVQCEPAAYMKLDVEEVDLDECRYMAKGNQICLHFKDRDLFELNMSCRHHRTASIRTVTQVEALKAQNVSVKIQCGKY